MKRTKLLDRPLVGPFILAQDTARDLGIDVDALNAGKPSVPVPLMVCECGEELPRHLLFALATHTCSCERHYTVDNPRTDKAAFRLNGTKRNPFARYDKGAR